MKAAKRGLSSLELSVIAAVCMTVDHFAVIFAAEHWAYFGMRATGRITFVIFAFLLADSVDKTSSVRRFCARLLLFAIISEPIFDLTFYKTVFYPGHQNVFFTLLAAVIAVTALKRKDAAGAAAAVLCAAAAGLLNADYGCMGVLLAAAFALFGSKCALIATAVFAAEFVLAGGGAYGVFALLAVPLIKAYNGSRGGEFAPVVRKWFFYCYYPAHLALLYSL